MSAKKAKSPSEEARAHLAAWRKIDELRTRLKGDALAARIGSGRRGPSVMELRLLDLDDGLATAARCARGWKDLKALHVAALKLAPKRPDVVDDIALLEADEARLAEEPWYVGGETTETAVERLLLPWRDVSQARAVLVARVRRGDHGAARTLAKLDEQVVGLISQMRVKKPIASILRRHIEAHETHGQLLAARYLLEDMRHAVQAIPALLDGRRVDVRPAFARAIKEAASKHGPSGSTFARIRERAFLRAYADRVESCASGFRRPLTEVQAALLAPDVQVLLYTDIKDASLRILERLRLGKPRSIEDRIAKSDADDTS